MGAAIHIYFGDLENVYREVAAQPICVVLRGFGGPALWFPDGDEGAAAYHAQLGKSVVVGGADLLPRWIPVFAGMKVVLGVEGWVLCSLTLCTAGKWFCVYRIILC